MFSNIKGGIKSKRGHETLTFLVFLFIAALMWVVMSLDDETQRDLRMPVEITHVPDSVTMISDVPADIYVSMRSKGSQILKQKLGGIPAVKIDYRVYKTRNSISLTPAEMKGIVRSALGTSAQIVAVSPDSLNLLFTRRAPKRLPVKADVQVVPGPRFTLVKAPVSAVDSVSVYSIGALPYSLTSIKTEPLRLDNVNAPTSVMVKLIAPKGTRVIPDSVAVKVEVEPLIIKQRKVVVRTTNVPSNLRLITFPAQVDVHYMVPMSLYQHTDPKFVVTADYHDISHNGNKVKLRLSGVPAELQNVTMATDSVEYILEQL